ncbi:MAG: YkgJ family cysteine cluster protein [Candidatus Methanoperedens sp.]|nr:YkgJ family cysteine cluster protein [Candidatus Methanoperedens sp.]MCZ7395444.1 YkgJ family cysteine cluster protein [Candidatus Methanoperedens sp.]
MIRTDDIEEEIQRIVSFPDEKFTAIIREVGFECDCCGKCCTSEFNDHVFLLDNDAARIINVLGYDFLRPAPYFDFCDNLGRFYVLGYALKSKPNGDCIFYTGGRCEHYEIRPDICKIFPYMLHREPDEDGNVEFRQIGGLNEHGLYHSDIDDETCKEIVRQVKTYESGFLGQKLRFLNAIKEHFKKHALKHSRQMYDRMMREYENGREIEVYVFFQGRFEKKTISKQFIKP